jgi:hypothetical protein
MQNVYWAVNNIPNPNTLGKRKSTMAINDAQVVK